MCLCVCVIFCLSVSASLSVFLSFCPSLPLSFLLSFFTSPLSFVLFCFLLLVFCFVFFLGGGGLVPVHVAVTLSNQPTKKHCYFPSFSILFFPSVRLLPLHPPPPNPPLPPVLSTASLSLSHFALHGKEAGERWGF